MLSATTVGPTQSKKWVPQCLKQPQPPDLRRDKSDPVESEIPVVWRTLRATKICQHMIDCGDAQRSEGAQIFNLGRNDTDQIGSEGPVVVGGPHAQDDESCCDAIWGLQRLEGPQIANRRRDNGDQIGGKVPVAARRTHDQIEEETPGAMEPRPTGT